MERSILKAPSSLNRLLDIAKKLKITKTVDKQKLFDLAEKDKTRIPKKSLTDNELTPFLPMFTHAASEEKLKQLAEAIKDEFTEREEEAK